MTLQSMINSQAPNGRLDLQPGEFFGQVTIDRPITIVGSGKGTWIGSRTSPTIKITVPGVRLQNLMVEIISDTEAIAVEAIPETDPVLQDVTLRGDTVGIAAGHIHSTETPSEENSADISFLPPPPMNSNLSGQYHQVPTSAPSPGPIGVSPIDQQMADLFQDAEEARNRGDWATSVDAYEDLRILAPDRDDVKRLLKRARRKMRSLESTSEPTSWGTVTKAGSSVAAAVASVPLSAAKDRVVQVLRRSKRALVIFAALILVVAGLFAARTGINVLEKKLERFEASSQDSTSLSAHRLDHLMGLVKRAEQGDAEIQNRLGNIYYWGIGVPEDVAEAARWYERSAKQGNAAGQYNLGLLHEKGRGVPKDLHEAKKWYGKAARRDYHPARIRLKRLGW